MLPKIIRILVLVLVIFTGCGQRKIIQKYYILEPPELRTSENQTEKYVIDARCEIKPVQITPAFSTHRIAVRQESHEITYFQYHEWAVLPVTAITNFINREFKAAGIFRQVGQNLSQPAPEYQFSARINFLEYRESDSTVSARLQMEMELRRMRDNKQMSVYSFDQQGELNRKNLNTFAETVSRMLHNELLLFFDKITKDISDE
jgi:ABC-type uncharacterized transport system auxiliary subunit